MRSRITIDVDQDNQPVIKIDYIQSDDIRDKLVKRFMESFRGESCFATFFFNNTNSIDYVNSIAHVRPIKPSEMESFKELFDSTIQNQKIDT